MIDWEKFNETYQYYGSEIVGEIIDIWVAEYDDRLTTLTKNIAERDFKALDETAHSFKGTVANFYDPEPVKYAYKLEQIGKVDIPDDDMEETFDQLKIASDKLLIELKEYRKNHS
ncbi:MAG: Hpt domain-containing protein [Bacteroidota bacterium]